MKIQDRIVCCISLLSIVGASTGALAQNPVRHAKHLGKTMPSVADIVNAFNPRCEDLPKACSKSRGPGETGGNLMAPVEASISSSLVSFETGSTKLSPQAVQVLDIFAQAMQDPKARASTRVEAHADKRGSDKLNEALSKARAEAIVEYLSRKGIDRARLTPEGKGSAFPLDVDNPANPLNRRAEFVLVYPDGAKLSQ